MLKGGVPGFVIFWEKHPPDCTGRIPLKKEKPRQYQLAKGTKKSKGQKGSLRKMSLPDERQHFRRLPRGEGEIPIEHYETKWGKRQKRGKKRRQRTEKWKNGAHQKRGSWGFWGE